MKATIRFTRLYDDALKHKVVKEYLEGNTTHRALCKKYKIRRNGAIAEWSRKLGYSKNSLQAVRPKKIRFIRQLIHPPMPGPEKSKLDLEKENRELKRKLEDANLRAEAYLRIVEKAEQELKINLKKKLNSR
jgi:transposase-like protein